MSDNIKTVAVIGAVAAFGLWLGKKWEAKRFSDMIDDRIAANPDLF